MALNERAATDARHARSGKDGALYSNGQLLATVESFSSNVSFNNSTYNVLGAAQEIETNGSYKVSLTMSQVVVESDDFIVGLLNGMKTGEYPNYQFQGVIQGRNGSQERIVYNNCILSGQVDLQNITVGDTIKRNWNFTSNSAPVLQDKLSI